MKNNLYWLKSLTSDKQLKGLVDSLIKLKLWLRKPLADLSTNEQILTISFGVQVL